MCECVCVCVLGVCLCVCECVSGRSEGCVWVGRRSVGWLAASCACLNVLT